jgi:hypothetical protein
MSAQQRPEPDQLDPVQMANQRAKGRRPVFFDDPAVERVLSIAMSIAGEVSVARERIDTLERLLEQRGILSAADIEAYQPDAAVQEARNVWGRDYIARVLRIVDQDVQAMAGAPEPSIDEVAAELGTPGNDQGKH